jgi:hypothetical protein
MVMWLLIAVVTSESLNRWACAGRKQLHHFEPDSRYFKLLNKTQVLIQYYSMLPYQNEIGAVQ